MGVYLGSHRVKLNETMTLRTDDSVLDSIIDRTISVYENPIISEIGSYTFYNCTSLTSIDLPQVTSIGSYAFYRCSSLASINLPKATSIGSSAFYNCSSLTSISLPKTTSIGSYAFAYCSSLISIDLPETTSIGSYAFRNCYHLLSLYLMGNSVISLVSTDVFMSTPISTYTTSTGGVYGSIFVPASLYSSYLTATNWSIYSARIVSR